MDGMVEIPVRIPMTSPGATALWRTGVRAALEVSEILRGRYRTHLVTGSPLSVWPVEQSPEALVFQARVPRAVLSASGGVNSLSDLVAVMLEEAALRLGKEAS
jgi:hypothetical protein